MTEEGRVSSRLTRGRRLFAAASVGLGMVAGLHAIGLFIGPSRAAGIEAAMRAFALDMGPGPQPSMWDVHATLNLALPIALLGIALSNLTILALASPVPGLIRRLTLLDLVIVGALVALHATYGVLPPVFTLGAVELLFLASLLLQRADDPD